MKNGWNTSVIFVDDEQYILEVYRRALLNINNLSLDVIKTRYLARKGINYIANNQPESPCLEFNLLFASSGEEGLRLVQQEKNHGRQVAVGFFDINMPGGIDGLETIRQIKQIEPKMLCAVVTGYIKNSISEIRQLFKHQDEWIYFNKPFTKGELEQAVINLVSLWNSRNNRTKLLKALQEDNRLLMRIANEINLKKDLDQTLDFIVKVLTQLTNSQRISIMLLDEAKQNLSIKKATGIDKEIIQSVSIKAGEPIAGEVLRKGKLLVVDDIHKLKDVKIYSSFKSFISVPLVMVGLKTYNNPLGIINITNKTDNENYTEDDLRIISYIANYASIAINNHLNMMRLEEAYFNTVETLAVAIETKYPYVRGHSKRVAEYSVAIARELELSESEIKAIRYGATLHDIGKITVSSAIIHKPGSLSEAEFAQVKKHSVVGEMMLKKIKFLKEVVKIVRHHHEKYNGNGYPDGLKADKIELGARIIAVADAYDAMLSIRPYRDALSVAEATAELKRNSGEQFDPQCVNALLKHSNKTDTIKICLAGVINES